jgi:predicted secreted protein
MAKYNGTKLKLLVGGTAISNLKDITLSVNGEMVTVTDKDSAGWDEVIPGLKKAEISGTCGLDSAQSNPATGVFTYILNGTSVSLIFYHTVTGQKSHTMTGYFTKFEQKGGTEDEIVVSFSIKATGAVTQTATT